MSLLKLASLQTADSFCRNTEAINSLVVVLPLEPPTTMTGNSNSMPVGRGGLSQRHARVIHDEHRAFRQQHGNFFLLHHDSGGTFGGNLVQEVVAIEAFAPDGKKQIARFCLPGIGADIGDRGFPGPATDFRGAGFGNKFQ